MIGRTSDNMGNFEGGFPQQDHHRRSEVYLSSTTPDLIFLRVLADWPVVYKSERCQLERNAANWA